MGMKQNATPFVPSQRAMRKALIESAAARKKEAAKEAAKKAAKEAALWKCRELELLLQSLDDQPLALLIASRLAIVASSPSVGG